MEHAAATPQTDAASGSSRELRSNGLYRLKFARSVTTAMVADVPRDKWCFQPIDKANHTMWVVGHLAVTDDFFLQKVAGQASRCPAGWNEIFGTGSHPQPELAAYPDAEMVLHHFEQRRQELLAWFESLEDAQLLAPLPEGLGFARNTVELMPSIAWHEAWHGGQLSVVRKALGMGPKFG